MLQTLSTNASEMDTPFKLFKGSIHVAFKSQVNIFLASFKLLFQSIVPMLVMILPVSFILAQMGMQYQARPAQLDDESIIVIMKLNDGFEFWPDITLETGPAIQSTLGPVRVLSKKEIYQKIKPVLNGNVPLIFKVGSEKLKKFWHPRKLCFNVPENKAQNQKMISWQNFLKNNYMNLKPGLRANKIFQFSQSITRI